MKILVTGAAGMLGTDVARAANAGNHEVVALGRAELDVTEEAAVAARFREERPQAVVNCAAYTDVDGAEDQLAEAMRVNADGARNVAAAASAVDARVVYISTDYVFDGSKAAPYVESDAPQPLSAYGRSKLTGEHETARANRRHQVVRSSWLFGAAGTNFVETMLRLGRDHGEVRVVRDQVGCPTYTADLADGVLRLAGTDAYGLHHIAGTGECSWYEFAMEIFRQSRVECRVLSCTSADFERPAKRPAHSALATERREAIRLPAWQDGLAAYLRQGVAAA